jgi:hypothetical protein
MYNLYKGYCQGSAISVISYVDGFYTKMSITLHFVSCIEDWSGNIHKKLRKRSPLPIWMGTVEASYCTMPFISIKIYRQRISRNGRLLPKWTICDRNCETQYFHLFRRTLPLLEDVPLNVREGMWFQHEGTLPQLSCQVRNWLNNHFSGTWIGSGDGGVE